MMARYFKAQTDKIADESLNEIKTIEDWQAHKDLYRKQMHEMYFKYFCVSDTNRTVRLHNRRGL